VLVLSFAPVVVQCATLRVLGVVGVRLCVPAVMLYVLLLLDSVVIGFAAAVAMGAAGQS